VKLKRRINLAKEKEKKSKEWASKFILSGLKDEIKNQ
jgi:hypothetical protein